MRAKRRQYRCLIRRQPIIPAFSRGAGLRTCNCQQLVANVYCRLVLVLVHSILSPASQKAFHTEMYSFKIELCSGHPNIAQYSRKRLIYWSRRMLIYEQRRWLDRAFGGETRPESAYVMLPCGSHVRDSRPSNYSFSITLHYRSQDAFKSTAKPSPVGKFIGWTVILAYEIE